MRNISLVRPSLPEFETFCAKIRPLWDTRYLTNMGVFHAEFTERLSRYLKTANISLFANGHLSLEMTLQAMGLEGEVITTPFTFISTTHAIVRSGLKPVFCDIKNDCTMDAAAAEELITDETSAILPVHVYGNVCDVERIERLSRKYGLKVIYDAAHAFGVEYKGMPVSGFGDASVFSFHATKVFHTLEGGAVASNSEKLTEDLYRLKNFGIMSETETDSIGANAKMDEFRAAMGLCMLDIIDDEITKRKIVYEMYNERLKETEGIVIQKHSPHTKPNYAYFPVEVHEGSFGISRDCLYERLKERGIMTRKYFYPLTGNADCYKGRYSMEHVPNASLAAQRVLTLPIHTELTIADIDYVCDAIKNSRKSE